MQADLKVLLVEDDPAVSEMYRLRLEIDGCSVAVAEDGETGLQLAHDVEPDLIYLDLRLPVLDGFEVLERIRSDARLSKIPVVILTNYSEPDDVERALGLGALEFLVKAETSPAALSERLQVWAAYGS
jgi:CheY-like chemotaxis protein